jgi:hypothetical protein
VKLNKTFSKHFIFLNKEKSNAAKINKIEDTEKKSDQMKKIAANNSSK